MIESLVYNSMISDLETELLNRGESEDKLVQIKHAYMDKHGLLRGLVPVYKIFEFMTDYIIHLEEIKEVEKK